LSLSPQLKVTPKKPAISGLDGGAVRGLISHAETESIEPEAHPVLIKPGNDAVKVSRHALSPI
jgi:hypothetical protein